MRDASSLCRFCHALLQDEENVSKLLRLGEEEQPHQPQTPIFCGELIISRTFDDILAGSQSSCPLCSILESDIRDTYDKSDVNISLEGAQVKIELKSRASSRDEPSTDFEGIFLLWCVPSLSEKWEKGLDFVFSAVAGNPAAELLNSRPYIENYLSDQSFKEANEMLHYCKEKHISCSKPGLHSLPARVLDLSDPIRLLATNGRKGKYAALSYCWGIAVQPVMTTRATISSLMRSVPMNLLPQTLSDAIYVAKRLGMQYLWADVLCIIQDDSADKVKQISEIPNIFSNSYITICAASAESCSSGFLDRGTDVVEPFELPFKCPGPSGEAGALVLQWAPSDYYGFDPIYRRAWTLEERLLSPRLLFYTSSGIVWQCQSGDYFIGQGRQAPDGNIVVGGRPSFTDRLDDMFFDEETDCMQGEEMFEGLRELWVHLVEDYSARSVTDPRDRLRAISGLAARFSSYFRGTYTYKAGLWHGCSEASPGKSFLLSQLLWRESSGPLNNPKDEKIPSWSWASVRNFVSWDTLPDIAAEPSQDVSGSVVDCIVHPLSPTNPFGQVENCSVTLQGMMRTASVLNPRLSLGNDIYLNTYLDASSSEARTTADAFFLLLLRNHGLILRKADQGYMRRIGIFYIYWDTDWEKDRGTDRVEQDDLAARKSRRHTWEVVEPGVKVFFKEGTRRVVTVI